MLPTYISSLKACFKFFIFLSKVNGEKFVLNLSFDKAFRDAFRIEICVLKVFCRCLNNSYMFACQELTLSGIMSRNVASVSEISALDLNSNFDCLKSCFGHASSRYTKLARSPLSFCNPMFDHHTPILYYQNIKRRLSFKSLVLFSKLKKTQTLKYSWPWSGVCHLFSMLCVTFFTIFQQIVSIDCT